MTGWVVLEGILDRQSALVRKGKSLKGLYMLYDVICYIAIYIYCYIRPSVDDGAFHGGGDDGCPCVFWSLLSVPMACT